ncbi:hypothetical protein FIBSPDRAFT_958694 [Athelia psychrophila]|uniref:Uncharacterized protein n=1 Tax=Athelia psychrophila TaxID=1759441 RepID=A0A166E8W8_9AGAM|nr:hypothetical protein FIBSPDRAFT_965488 [Fibularhizoctonia sp. CBS 109695]KZP15519.1 hypothetical protein FIBSPDRAFT_958694 [Fibularhizoctonia sp. CBS 109695]
MHRSTNEYMTLQQDTYALPAIDDFPWDHLMQFVTEPMDVDPSSPATGNRYTSHSPGRLVAESSGGRPIATPLATPQLPTPPDSHLGSGSPEDESYRAAPHGALSEPAAYVSVSTTFYPGSPPDAAPSDTVLLSEDAVWFYVDAATLLRASDNSFNALLAPHPHSPHTHAQHPHSPHAQHPHPPARTPLIALAQPARVLNLLLHAAYARSPVNYHPAFADLAAAARLLPTYGLAVPAPPAPLYTLLAAHAPHHPLALYVLAAQLDAQPLAAHASAHLHSLALSAITDADACAIGPVYLKRLFFLHYGRADALKRILLAPPRQHAPTKGCDYLDQRGLARAWALASAYLAWDSRPDVSAAAIERALTPLSNQLTCELCRGVLTARIAQLLEDWRGIKVSI